MNWDNIYRFEIVSLFMFFVFAMILAWWTDSISILDIGILSLIGAFAIQRLCEQENGKVGG